MRWGGGRNREEGENNGRSLQSLLPISIPIVAKRTRAYPSYTSENDPPIFALGHCSFKRAPRCFV